MAAAKRMTKAQVIGEIAQYSELDKKSVNRVFESLQELIRKQLSARGPGEFVVPGLVKHSIELRDLSAEKIARLGREIQERAQQIARETKTDISMKQFEHDDAAIATPEVQLQIEAASAGLGLKTMRLPSGAGHDAQVMAKLGPMGMIFVPSVGGISHSPKELTRWADCANGANVLLETVLRMDGLSIS